MDKQNMLDFLFDMRVNDVATTNEEENKLMKISNEHFDKLLDFLKENLSDEKYHFVENLFDDVYGNLMLEIGATNEKYYKSGFSDAIELIIDSLSYNKPRGD